MKYSDFDAIITSARMGRYMTSCGNNSRKAMTLYRKNLKLSQELFTVISCFEIALRNKIDNHYINSIGNDWLRNAASVGGIFDTRHTRVTQNNINDAITKLQPHYSHHKLVAELGFGFWRYMFANRQFMYAGSTLLSILPLRPPSAAGVHYNHNYILGELAKLNDIRNRIAHHEPICFLPGQPIKDTQYARTHYNLILQLFNWMNIDEAALLYGLDHVNTICNEIDAL